GYAPRETYETGIGTRPSAAVFAQNGFITVAPDFLGYGGSDPRDEDEMAGRFESYPIALILLRSLIEPKFVCALPDPTSCPDSSLSTRHTSLFLFGHSNGGHIAIATLEIAGNSPSFAGKTFPTVLWAPVSKPFPFSTLVYTDEADDLGKLQRKNLAKFEEDYDVNLYSVHNYLDWIKSPIQLHQGYSDQEILYWWSQEFEKTLTAKSKTLKAFYYPGMNHNMTPGWNTAISRSLAFFRSHTK
ncbi:MAG: prolyl oligopeptidase family serine peptidase, partial [Patescibacteria group bacterium]